MTTRDSLDTYYLCWFSKPKCERELFRLVKEHGFTSILEVGLRDLERSTRLIRLAQRHAPPDRRINYTGIDLFEARDVSATGLTLKQAHRTLSPTGAKIRLLPGRLDQVLEHYANQLSDMEIVIISGDVDAGSLSRAWRYVPRMLTLHSLVMSQFAPNSSNPTTFRRVPLAEIERLARTGTQTIRKAA